MGAGMELLTIEEVADRLRVSVLTVRWLRQEGRRQCGGLKVLFRGRRVAYRTRHLLAVTPVPKPVCLCSRRPQFPFEDAREYALGAATLLYGDRRPIVSHPEGRLPVSPVRYLAPTEGPLHAYRAASPKDEIPWQ